MTVLVELLQDPRGSGAELHAVCVVCGWTGPSREVPESTLRLYADRDYHVCVVVPDFVPEAGVTA